MVARGDHRVLAIDVKLAQRVDDRDVRNLPWLAARLGDELRDSPVITTGSAVYRRRDSIAVVPAALFGPWPFGVSIQQQSSRSSSASRSRATARAQLRARTGRHAEVLALLRASVFFI